MSDTQTFALGTVTIPQLGQSVETFLRTHGDLEVVTFDATDGYLIQARENGGEWRKYVGLDKAIQVRLMPNGPGMVSVSVGEGKWIDKIGVGLVGAIWIAPLMLVAGFGALSQMKLASDVMRHVAVYLSVNTGNGSSATPAEPSDDAPVDWP